MGELTFQVMDCETSVIKRPDGKWDARPYAVCKADHFRSPHAFAIGTQLIKMASGDADAAFGAIHTEYDLDMSGKLPVFLADTGVGTTPLVGHNIKFDAQHVPAIHNAPGYWDTMVAEYILTAQREKFASLSRLVSRYVPGRAKPDVIGENLAVGVTPDMIPEAELIAYLRNDVEVTGKVFAAQWAAATPLQRSLIMLQSAATIVYASIESAGLDVDVTETRARAEELERHVRGCVEDMLDLWQRGGAAPEVLAALEYDDNLMTPRAMSSYFFGSPAMFEVKVPKPPGTKGRGKFTTAVITPPPGRTPPFAVFADPAAVGAAEHASLKGVYLLADDVLERLKAAHSDMVGLLQKHRTCSKLHGTYYSAWLKDLEDNYADGRLHTKINACATDTGRTSSSAPNGQNMPEEVRECIIAGAPGAVFVEADFKQLEVCGLAIVSGCPALTAALKHGDDVHFLSGKKVFGWTTPSDMSKKDRRTVKAINFGLIYGGSAKGLAANAGISEELARDLIDSFYSNFPGVRKWHTATYNYVEKTPDKTLVVPGVFGTTKVHILSSPTGRDYAFDLEAPPWAAPGSARFRPSPTKVKNYPVQGFATADVVPLALVMLRDALKPHPSIVIVNAVHDSVLLRCPAEDAFFAQVAIEDVVDRLPAAIEALWGIEIDVPLGVDIKASTEWAPRPPGAYAPKFL